MPAITNPVDLDATTEWSVPGVTGGVPDVQLEGTVNGVTIYGDGLDLAAGAYYSGYYGGGYTTPGSNGSTVRGLIITGFKNGYGIEVDSNGNTIAGDSIGLNASGAQDANGTGIGLIYGYSNTIGGTTVLDRNVISGNGGDGVEIDGGNSNFVQGNYIGTDVTGTVALGNGASASTLTTELWTTSSAPTVPTLPPTRPPATSSPATGAKACASPIPAPATTWSPATTLARITRAKPPLGNGGSGVVRLQPEF